MTTDRVGPRPEGRVRGSHRITAAAFRLGGLFGLVALAWAIIVTARGGSWWGPLHAFLAGSVLLAISGATQLFTVTWAAATPPSGRTAATQRWALACGVGLVLGGVRLGSTWLVVSGAALVVFGLGLLASIILAVVRRSLLRRFDLSSRFYLLALGAGMVGVALGGLMGAGVAGSGYPTMLLVHSRLNLIGLVGLTIIGTLPTLLPTLAHHRVVSGFEARLAWWLGAIGVSTMAAGLLGGEAIVGAGVLLVAASLLAVLLGVVLRLGRRCLAGGLPYHQVVLGCGWLAAWAIVDGLRVLTGSGVAPLSPWITAAVVAGVGQVLLGSLAYLVPVLAGRPPRLGRNLGRTMTRPWVPVSAANLAGLAMVVGTYSVAGVLVSIWVVDFASRLLGFEWHQDGAPPRRPGRWLRPWRRSLGPGAPVPQADSSTAKGQGTPTSGPLKTNSS